MKSHRITRRQFFKTSAFGAGSLALPAVALASVATAPSHEAQAATVEPHKLAIPQPTFNPIASTTAFGPPTDIAAGWDGTLWAIDASGAPHVYDPTQDAWLAHGDGIDAAAAIGNTLYLFRGPQYVTVNVTNNQTSAPVEIATTWPALPDSFKLRVTGAAVLAGKLTLFNGGWFVPADGSHKPRKLADMNNWPTTSNWTDGLVDAVIRTEALGADIAIATRGTDYVVLSVLFGVFSASDPIPITSGIVPAPWVQSGIDAGTLVNDAYYYYKGTQVIKDAGAPQYIATAHANWPVIWNPRLQHAPSGRMGNLWVSAVGGQVLRHDGESWIATPGVGPSTSVGQDNSVYIIAADTGLFRWNGATFDPQGSLAPLTQVSVGDDGHVWVRDSSNTVHRYIGNNTFVPVNLGAGVSNPTHIAANNDGTLWHCNSGVADAHRFISGSTAPSAAIPIKNGVVTGVQRVASTGFGAAHCLVTQSGQSQPQVYRYDSPYLFKTSKEYLVWPSSTSSFAQGLGNLYFVQKVSNPTNDELFARFVAVDMHTGREVASFTPTDATKQYSGMVFDPIHELVYVGTTPFNNDADSSTPGTLYALDARTLTVKWTFKTQAGIDATPALSGTTLCFGDRTAVVYCIDTEQALAAVAQNKLIPTRWTFQIDINGPTHRVSTPLFDSDQVIATMWDIDYDPKEGLSQFQTVSIAASDGSGLPFGLDLPSDSLPRKDIDFFFILQPPILGYASFPGFAAPTRALFVRAATTVIAYNLENNQQNQNISFKLPGGVISSGLIYDDGSWLGSGLSSNGTPPSRARLWFGDNQGNLWALDNELKPADGTPYLVRQNTEVYTAPVLYKDPQGGLTVLFGVLDPSGALPPSLYGYDPDNGNHASVSTGVTTISMLSSDVTNGVIYAGGTGLSVTAGNPVQVFGIRVDELPQALHDFIIESQLMQDPDQNAAGGSTDPNNPIPPSVARYQTHLTVVDDQKNPVPHEPVKIWCDAPNTKITVDGQSFTVGPDDASYAAIKTGADGALVITMDATDYFAPPLRAWASFMDPYERIVVNADAEFHQRVMTAHANAGDDDPTKVNLQTAANYNGQSLFTDAEKSANPSAPQNVANSIQQANKGLGLSNGNSKGAYRKMMRAMGVSHKNQRVQVRLIEGGPTLMASQTATYPSLEGGELASPPDKYMAYADLPGATHFPTNIPSARLASIVQPVGLSFSRPNGDVTKAPTFTALSHADARAAIDGLQGEPWKPTDPQRGLKNAPPSWEGLGVGAPFCTFNIFQDFWNWLKGLLDKIAQCILSIADDILVGIQYFVDGVLKVFKAIIKVLEDVFPFLGSFFKMLEKLIDDVVAALSVLFHFGEIIKMHRWMASQIVATLNQARTVITSTVQPAIDDFFKQGEDAIKGFFDQLRSQFNPGQGIKTLKGSDATAHTAFAARAGSAGSNSGGSSHAVQCTWGTQKLKSNMPDAAEPTLTTSTIQSAADDPLSNFVTAFVARITNDQDLGSTLDQLKSDFSSLFQVSSAKQFFTTLLDTLLDIVEALLIGMLAVSSALIDGMIGIIEALFDTVMGFLSNPIDVPVISWLYKTLFNENLTYLNLITLVAAIPVTILYRVVEGHYPSADGVTDASSIVTAHGARLAAVEPSVMAKIFASFGAVFALGLGIARAFVDIAGAKPPPTGVKLVLLFGLLYLGCYFPLITSSTPTAYAWSSWGIGLVLAFLGTFGIVNLTASEATKQVFKYTLPFLRCVLGLARLVVICVGFVKSGKTDATSDVTFVRTVFLEWPPILNPIRLIPEVGPLALSIVDGVTGIVVCGLDFYLAFGTSSPAPQRRLYFPFVPVMAAAHPVGAGFAPLGVAAP